MFKPDKPQRNLIISIVVIAISITTSSCQKGKNLSPEEGFASYSLEKEREFLIHSLSTVELLDYYPKDSLYLGYTITHSGKEICLVKEDGQIILSRNMQGEGPNQHAANLSCLGFAENGDIYAMTSVQVLRYNQNLELLEKFTYEPMQMTTFYTISKKFNYHLKYTNQSEIIFTVNPSDVSRNNFRSSEAYQYAKLVEFYDQKDESTKEIGLISERNITEELLGIVKGFYAPIYILNAITSKLYLTTTLDNEITIYDMNADSVSAKINIYYSDPNAIEPSKKISPQTLSKNPDGWLLSPKNHNIHKLDNGLFALEYHMVSINPNPNQDIQEYDIDGNVYKNRLILFDQNCQLSGDLALPVKGIIMSSIPGNRLLVRVENSEVEEDFTRYVIYKVMKEEE